MLLPEKSKYTPIANGIRANKKPIPIYFPIVYSSAAILCLCSSFITVQNHNWTAKLAKILEDRGVLSDFISNFASEIEPKSWLFTSEKVLFELSLFSKFSQNSLINRKINTSSTCIDCYLHTHSGYYIANRCGYALLSLLKAMREAY